MPCCNQKMKQAPVRKSLPPFFAWDIRSGHVSMAKRNTTYHMKRCRAFTGALLTWSAILHENSSPGFYPISGRTAYRKISWSLEAARFIFRLFHSSEDWQAPRQQSAEMPVKYQRCTIIITSNLTAYRLQVINSKTSCRLVKRGP